MLHEMTVGADGPAAADERQRPSAQMRQFPSGDFVVIAREVELGDAVSRKDVPFRMAQGDARDDRPHAEKCLRSAPKACRAADVARAVHCARASAMNNASR